MIVAEQQSGDLERGPGARVDQSGQYREHRRIERVGAGCHPARRLATGSGGEAGYQPDAGCQPAPRRNLGALLQ